LLDNVTGAKGEVAAKNPIGRVVVADDEPGNIQLLTRLMRRLGYEVVGAPNGALAYEAVIRNRPDVVLLDVNMPEMDGFEVCRRLKRDPSMRLTPIILLTALTATSDRVTGIDAGADDFVTKPFVIPELEARVRSLTRLKRYTDELEDAESVILTLALTIEERDSYTHGHCERLAQYATAFAERLRLDEAECRALYRGGFLHDIGKIAVPDSVLLKMGPLDAAELALMKQHPVVGERLCGELRSLEDVRPIIRHHHERPDGSGYPDGLKDDETPLLARIMSIVDSFDALTTDRPYRKAMTNDEACHELTVEAAKGWKSADLTEAFVRLVSEPNSVIGRPPRSSGYRRQTSVDGTAARRAAARTRS
jgi:putative two-component system response regulator